MPLGKPYHAVVLFIRHAALHRSARTPAALAATAAAAAASAFTAGLWARPLRHQLVEQLDVLLLSLAGAEAVVRLPDRELGTRLAVKQRLLASGRARADGGLLVQGVELQQLVLCQAPAPPSGHKHGGTLKGLLEIVHLLLLHSTLRGILVQDLHVFRAVAMAMMGGVVGAAVAAGTASSRLGPPPSLSR